MANPAKVKIEYVKRIDGTPVMPFVLDAYTSLRRAGNIEACDCPASGEEEAFYVLNRAKKVVAVLSFFVSDSDSTEFVINMGFVTKRCRKHGYYSALWARLVDEGRRRGLQRIIGYHKPGNGAILGFNARSGRTIKYICSEFTL